MMQKPTACNPWAYLPLLYGRPPRRVILSPTARPFRQRLIAKKFCTASDLLHEEAPALMTAKPFRRVMASVLIIWA